jgi:hypothetical protein
LDRVHGDMHRLASSLLDIAVNMQRLESKLDMLSEGVACMGERRITARNKTEMASDAGRVAHNAERDSIASPGRNMASDGKVGVSADSFDAEAGAAQEKSDSVQSKEAAISPDSGQQTDVESALWQSGRQRDNHVSMEIGGLPETDRLQELYSRLGSVDRKVDRIAVAVGVKGGGNEGDDEEDRKRLKEKLKVAIELDRRSRIRTIVSKREVWLEYIFGICSPDQRIGKRGSRWYMM